MGKTKTPPTRKLIDKDLDQMFKALFESANEGIVVATTSGTIVMINPSGERMFGYERGELLGRKVEVLIPSHLERRHKGHRRDYNKDPKPRSMGIGMDLSAVRKDKSEFPVEVSLSHAKIKGESLIIAFVIDITERKKAAEVREQTWLLGRVFEESVNEIYMFDGITLKFIKVNQGALNNMGYSIAEMQELTPIDIKPEFTKATFTKLITPLTKGSKQKIDFQTIHQRKDGSTYPVEVHLQSFDHGSRPVLMAIILDISDRKQAEASLRIRERALMAANNGILISDAQLRNCPIIYCNEAFEKITGYSREEVLGRNCRFLQNDDRDQKAIVNMRKAIKKGVPCQVTLRNYRKDGTMFWNELSITPIRDGEGHLTHFIGVQNDVTERKKVEEKLQNYSLELELTVAERTAALQESQKLYSTIARNFPDGTINVFDRDLRYAFVEGKELYALGISSEMLMGTKYVDRLAPEIAKTTEKELMEVFKGKAKSVEIRFKNNDYVLDAVPLPDEKGEVKQILVIEKNVTEHKRVQDQIRLALRKEQELGELKSRFVSMASHEFRTPLSTILSSASLIDRYQEAGQGERRRKHTTRIKSSVNNLTGILNDFLSLDKLEAGKIASNPTDFDLAAFTQEICQDLEPTLKRDQKIDCKYQGRKKVYLDKQMVHNIQNNLLSNAIKYSPERSTVSLVLKNREGKVTIKIKDRGIGIDEADQKHLFERFFRAKNAVNLQGTGLGLNIVKKYVDLMGGSIKFSSKVNKGSTFTVTLPQGKK